MAVEVLEVTISLFSMAAEIFLSIWLRVVTGFGRVCGPVIGCDSVLNSGRGDLSHFSIGLPMILRSLMIGGRS